jgi:hypothetical protein
MIRVTIHRHEVSPIDVTDRVESVSIRESVRAPWGSISLRLALPNKSPMFGGIAVGDWVVVTDESDAALGWGIVPFQRHDDRANGPVIDNAGRTIEAVSWLDYLGQVDLLLANGRSQTVGTMFNTVDWQKLVIESQRRVSGQLGEVMATMLRTVARILLPDSLGGEYVGDGVRVVHDDVTARAYAPRVTVDPVYGPSWGGFQTSMPSGGRALSVLLAGMAGDERLIEIFPARAAGGSFSRETTIQQASDDQLDPFGATRRKLLRDSGLAGPDLPRFKTVTRNEQRPAVSRALGITPVLVYRHAPWRTTPLDAWQEEQVARFGIDAPSLELDTARRFERVTWPTAGHVDIPASRVYSATRTLGLADDYTAVTVGLPNDPDGDFKWLEPLGLPIFAASPLQRYGLRLLNVSWPFFGPGDGGSQSHLLGVAWQGAQWYLGGGRFSAGTVTMAHDGRVLPGESFSVGIGPDRRITGYANTVTQTYDVSGDSVGRQTSIDYSRGITTTSDSLSDQEQRERPFAPKGAA